MNIPPSSAQFYQVWEGKQGQARMSLGLCDFGSVLFESFYVGLLNDTNLPNIDVSIY